MNHDAKLKEERGRAIKTQPAQGLFKDSQVKRHLYRVPRGTSRNWAWKPS